MRQRNSLTPEPVSPRTSTRGRTVSGNWANAASSTARSDRRRRWHWPARDAASRPAAPRCPRCRDRRTQHRMKPESPLEVRRRTFLLRVRPDQGGVQIDDHLASRSDRATPLPHRPAGGRPRPPDRGDRRARVITERIDEPTDRRIRGHDTEQFRLSPHQRRIRQTLTTKCDRDGQIQHRLTRIMDRTHRPPGLQRRGQFPSKAADVRSLQQQQ